MQALIESFYTAFQRRDAEGMVACYHPQVTFNDPVFRDLKGERAMGMWRMLVARGKDLHVTFRDVRADGQTGSAHWEATYTFSSSGRRVHNVIEARFRFADGKIIEHTDTFAFWRWAAQALGTPGLLLGWTPFLRRRVQQTALRGLDAFMTQGG